jgi:hypothetical protein
MLALAPGDAAGPSLVQAAGAYLLQLGKAPPETINLKQKLTQSALTRGLRADQATHSLSEKQHFCHKSGAILAGL